MIAGFAIYSLGGAGLWGVQEPHTKPESMPSAVQIIEIRVTFAKDLNLRFKGVPCGRRRVVDQMNTLYGAHPGVRANHATGAVFEGTFTGAVKSATRVLKKI
jgi:hypothetical protein